MTRKLPKISVITPSYNQGKFIQQTIESVLSQNYPNIEYVVMDGGSKDQTIKILEKYKDKLSWISEKDKGQSDAINKGLKTTSGEIVAYINSDDYYIPGSFLTVGKFFSENKDAYWLTGKCKIVDEDGLEVRGVVTFYKDLFLKYLRFKNILYIVQFISQPATFWRRELLDQIGFFEERLDYDMDYDYWLKIWQKYKLYYLDEYLASYRVHNLSKAVVSAKTQFETAYKITKRYTRSKLILVLHQMHAKLAQVIYRKFWIKNEKNTYT
ncbi:glycosyltransferase [Candidatus Gottesmanbacteria bacterium]|nr:glycosyltransferase [Candidatus Gottesmanbacteria bacterium]